MYALGVATLVEAIRREVVKAEEAGLSRYALAQKAGVSHAMLSRIMAGTRRPGADVVDRLAAALDLEIVIRPKRAAKGQ